MRVAAISDTHGRSTWILPPCDVFIHAGDMTGRGSLQETAQFAARLKEQLCMPDAPHHILLVPGNHDACFETMLGPVRDLFDANVQVLCDESLVLDGVCFYGSPWTPPFMNWHFMADEERLRTLYENMPPSVDVLITHGPPYGVLDPGWKVPHVGSIALAAAIAKRNIKHHLFGHLHAAGGQMAYQEGITFYNVAGCNDDYKLVHPARVFEVEPSMKTST